MEPLRLPLQHLHVVRVAVLASLQFARERIGETLDAGEGRLQLVRREAEEAILARLALSGGEHRAGAREERPQRAEIAQAAVEPERERADHLLAHPEGHSR